MTVAVLDLGTNTFHLLIVKHDADGTRILHKSKAAVKLGEGGITSGAIAEIPFRRGLSAIKRFHEIIIRHSPEKIVALGTAAIRNASNSDAFLKSIEAASGIQVQIIDGMKEASLIYLGVKQAIAMGAGKSLIMDIGGGSVEFIIADADQVYWKHSFELGAALLLEQFSLSDPLAREELDAIQQHLENKLQPLLEAAAIFKPATLIGSSGSFDTFAEMIAYRFYKPGILKNKTSYDFKMEDYRAIHDQLIFSTTEERKKMKGLIAMRVDMIVIAAIILTFVLDKLKIKDMRLSTYALKEGALWKILNNQPI